MTVENKNDANYRILFTPNTKGNHVVCIKINGFPTLDSPYICRVFPKEDVTFDPDTIAPRSRSPSPTRRDSDGEWELQKGYTSALLSKTEDSVTSHIHASALLDGDAHAWKVRIITACPKLRVLIGCSQKGYISHLDEDFFSSFDLSDYVTINQHMEKIREPNRRQRRRKRSIFERSVSNFLVILDKSANVMKVISEETQNEQSITLKGNLQHLYPAVNMKHHCHKDNCPRPIISFV